MISQVDGWGKDVNKTHGLDLRSTNVFEEKTTIYISIGCTMGQRILP